MLSTLLPAATGQFPISSSLFCRSPASFRGLPSSAAWIGRNFSPGAIATGTSIAGTGSSFGWDDVSRIAAWSGDHPSDLRGYFDRVRASNRGTLYPVTASYGMPAFFSLERAAAPFFGIKPHGISCKKNIIKECQEEAGIPEHIANRAVPVGAVSYMDIDGQRYKRDILFCYDLKLPDDFVPENEDGEVDSFRLFPIDQVANIVRRTEFFKPNCCLVIIDFLFRHGFIGPDDSGYLELLQSLRNGDCS